MSDAACNSDRRCDGRVASYLLLAAVMILLAIPSYGFHWQGTQQLHSLLELTATLSAFFVGIMAWSMYRADTRQTSLLVLSLGFFGTAVLDGYHCVATTTAFADLFPSSIESLVPWSWHASRTYLSIYVCLALWVTGKRECGRKQVATIASWSAVGLTTFCFVFFAFLPLPPAYFVSAIGGRPQEYIPALFFLAALVGHLRSDQWKTSRLEHWCVLSLIVSVATQSVFMSQSHAIFDCMFDLAHVLKIVSYGIVGTGLTLSMADLFRSAEDAKLMAYAVKHTQHGVAILDRQSRIDFVNNGFEKLTGYSREEALGGSVAELISNPSKNQVEWEQIERCFGDGAGCEWEIQCQTKSGDDFWASTELRPVSSAAGEIDRFILFLRDTTQQRLDEIEKAKLTDELLTVSRKVGMSEIATGTLHNVGNVLNSVNISVSVLRDNSRSHGAKYIDRIVELIAQQEDFGRFVQDDERGKNLPRLLSEIAQRLRKEQDATDSELRTLVENVEHIKQIVSMQQSFARVGGVTELLDIVDLIRDAVRMHEAGIARRDIEVEFETDDDTPRISTDRHKVLQILVNFIGNAKQAIALRNNQRGKITIAVDCDQSNLRVHVRDNGIGISAENLPRIFGRGFTTKQDGHGFGLHSSALAAQELGGSLSVQSEGEGTGATFTLCLPLEESEATKLASRLA